jgi:two-component system, cell cycle response regulator
MRVLLAQADDSCRHSVRSALESAGHECWVVASGLAAWDVLVSDRVDVVVSDEEMPSLSGVELCQRVRAHHEIAYPYFILLTVGRDGEDILRGLKAGVDAHLAKPPSSHDLQASLIAAERVVGLHRDLADRDRSLASAQRELLNNRSALDAAKVNLIELAQSDTLTGLSSRQRLNDDVAGIQSRLDRYGHRFSIAMLDMDNFEAYNDEHGQQAGDRLLVEVGRAIAEGIRPGDSAYRYAGEEFLIVYPNQRLGTAAVGAERLRRRVAQVATLAKLPGPGTLSAGIAESGRTDRFEDVVKRADYALHQAKLAGRNRVTVEPNV